MKELSGERRCFARSLLPNRLRRILGRRQFGLLLNIVRGVLDPLLERRDALPQRTRDFGQSPSKKQQRHKTDDKPFAAAGHAEQGQSLASHVLPFHAHTPAIEQPSIEAMRLTILYDILWAHVKRRPLFDIDRFRRPFDQFSCLRRIMPYNPALVEIKKRHAPVECHGRERRLFQDE